MKKRICAILLSLALIIPSIPVGSKAVAPLVPIVGAGALTTAGSVLTYAGALTTAFDLLYNAADFVGALGDEAKRELLDSIMARCGYGEYANKAALDKLCVSINAMFTEPSNFEMLVGRAFGLSYFQCEEIVASLRSYGLAPFHVTDIEESGESRWVIVSADNTVIVADSQGRYPYALNVTDRFVPTSQLSGKVNPVGEDELAAKLSYLVTHGQSGGVAYMNYSHKGGNYSVIGYTDEHTGGLYLYADEQGNFYGRYLGQLAVDKPRDPVEVIVPDGDAIIVEDGADMEINIEDGIYYMPDGTLAFIENLVYNPDNKSYTITANGSFNTTNNTYYEYNTTNVYFIEYTSVTYIGSTGEYTEEYKYYYELPDGRSSADLTAEELEALNTYIDVLPYIRSADDTSIRALYHFDGDTLDSSYWSHIGNFGWDKGASITYLEANAFNGCLYLDETEHQFHIQLPSNIGSKDFTMQFRYYQSYTAAPQLDSYVSIDGTKLIQFNGASLLDGSGTVLNAISVGNWQEICLQRIDGTLSIFLNGVPVGASSVPAAFMDSIQFVFGSSQQTYKYFDEFRFVDKPVYPASGYTPSSVPFDTNLALVLPDSALPVADEYWSFTSSKTNLLTQFGLDDWWGQAAFDSDHFHRIEPAFASGHPSFNDNNVYFDGLNFVAYTPTTVFSAVDAVSFTTQTSYRMTDLIGTDYWSTALSTHVYGPGAGIFTRLFRQSSIGYSINDYSGLGAGDYTFSVVLDDGSVYSLPFTIPEQKTQYYNGSYGIISQVAAGDYLLNLTYGLYSGSYQNIFLQLVVPYDVTPEHEFIYLELVEGNSTDLQAEFVQDVVVMEKESLNTPSLAVRTDQTITGYQIGGVRPSLPQKGLVWALVESSRITSLQIYNGQAWVEVDGRIWTGQRWVPYYAYDVLLLKDLYDVVGANPDKDYIYTESGFWSWLQTAWGQMMAKLEQIRVAITDGTGGGSGGDSSALPDVPPTAPDADDGWSFVDLVVELADGTWLVVRKAVGLTVGGLAGFARLLLDVGDLFDALDPDSLGGLFVIPLE